MPRFLRSLSLALSVAAVVGCAGDAVAPRSDAAPAGPNFKIKTLRINSTSATITVNPAGGTFTLGKHSIRFPKHSICALNSTYGPTEWDKPCALAQGPVTFHVEMVSLNGRQWLDFTPAVRFVPTTKVSNYVMLSMRVDNISRDFSEDDMQILWSPAIGVPGIDESVDDPTLRTKINWGAGQLQRRIKHFSGYTVREGDPIGRLLEADDDQ
jgi:hypothetical protein